VLLKEEKNVFEDKSWQQLFSVGVFFFPLGGVEMELQGSEGKYGFFFFLAILRFELQGLYLEPLHQPFFCDGSFSR
jgi:hypothetical protein